MYYVIAMCYESYEGPITVNTKRDQATITYYLFEDESTKKKYEDALEDYLGVGYLENGKYVHESYGQYKYTKEDLNYELNAMRAAAAEIVYGSEIKYKDGKFYLNEFEVEEEWSAFEYIEVTYDEDEENNYED